MRRRRSVQHQAHLDTAPPDAHCRDRGKIHRGVDAHQRGSGQSQTHGLTSLRRAVEGLRNRVVSRRCKVGRALHGNRLLTSGNRRAINQVPPHPFSRQVICI